MSNPSQDAVSAVERVFQIPELVFAITENLKRERIDLVTLSLVSRFWRSMARKALLRDLDIPLTNWFKIDNFIIRNPKLVADIRHIRLWDDNLHATSRWRGAWRPTAALVRLPPPPPQQRAHPLDSVPSSKWYGLEGALGSLFPKDSKEHPTLDVSIGIANIGSFKVLLARTPRALSAIVSLRIVIDHPKTSSTDLSQSDSWADLTGIAQWDAIRGLLRDINDAQRRRPSSPKLKLFHIEDSTKARVGRHSLQEFYWAGLAAELHPTIESLRLHLSLRDTAGATGLLDASLGGPLALTWPHLRSVALIMPSSTPSANPQLQDAIISFLKNQPLLEDIEICAGHKDEFQGLYQHTFPKLRSLATTALSPAIIGPFLSRHTDLQELRVSELYNDPSDWSDLPAMPNLCIVRAPLQLVRHLHNAGSRPSQIELSDSDTDADPDTFIEQVQQGSPEAQAISCLSLSWASRLSLMHTLVTTLGHLLSAERFPALRELVLINAAPEEKDYPVFPGRSTHYLELLLHALVTSSRLQALHVREASLEPLSLDSALYDREFSIPPRLEYISWTSIMHNRTQYFRIIRDRPSKARFGKLQALHASFALHSLGPGVWEAPGLRRRDDTLFNHTATPPQLKPWS
ncbi:hypothetical protein V8E36_009873 [Tilletia maclaganii]